jgi:cytochrome c5
MSDQHNALIKTPRQLITVVILAFVVPVIVIVLLTVFVAGSKTGGAGSDAMTPEAISDRLKPVGTVALQGASGPRTLQSGEAVYKAACAACHAAGAAGAPKTGDAGAWGARLRQGFDTLVKHAVDGFKGMPAKGGNPDLDPIEVARAVAFMGNQSGGKFTEPAAPAATAVATTGGTRSGEQIVKQVCSGCHETGKGGAPKIGDRTAWAKRVSHGVDAVTTSAIKGHAGMPARGGMASLTDPEMKSAVLYMFNAGGGAAAAAAGAAAAGGAAAPAPAPAAAAAGGKPDGAKIYAAGCNACHATGVAGAPKFGDKAAWAPRVKLGVAALTASVVKGKGAMPPKGGQPGASEADLRAAVEHMLAAVK